MKNQDQWSRCQNCDGVFVTDNLAPVQDMDERVSAGEVTPSGECPKCGAVCHLLRPDVVVEVQGGIAVIYTAAPMDALLVDWDVLDERGQPVSVREWMVCTPPFSRMDARTREVVNAVIAATLEKKSGVDA